MFTNTEILLTFILLILVVERIYKLTSETLKKNNKEKEALLKLAIANKTIKERDEYISKMESKK